MVIYINLDDDNYLTGWGSTQSNGNIKIYISDEEVLSNPEIFKYEDGELIKDEEKQKELIKEREEEENAPSKIDELIESDNTNALATMDLSERELKIGRETCRK